ncbi:hypothetical protein BDP55DRAFT_141317 [Colletotrichum godetiae]|uniref:Uncharacterized protein n=1 Tax=Colletotrichum godetiae TaxID=1209918 RepID=A0AAJ0B1I1_9PEZI|nr:uncharacterized protein BDP55DRAFT_141317 [Colletotrichum godetiae]KAK1700718.1 hypothetical protein BDP55DRAFT_141317 [Colletotrichum godetiae]
MQSSSTRVSASRFRTVPYHAIFRVLGALFSISSCLAAPDITTTSGRPKYEGRRSDSLHLAPCNGDCIGATAAVRRPRAGRRMEMQSNMPSVNWYGWNGL